MVSEDSEGIREPPSSIKIRPNWLSTSITHIILFVIPLISTIFAASRGDWSWIFLSLMLIVLSFLRFTTVSSIGFNDQGLYVPDLWITRKFIPWTEIVSIESFDDEKIIVIKLDTAWTRIVRTGLTDTQLILDNKNFDLSEFDLISQTIIYRWNLKKKVPDTLNERLVRQVETAWNMRYKQWLYDFFDDFTFGIYLLLQIELVFYILSGEGFNILVFLFIVPLLIIYSLFSNYDVPNSIIAIRPHELGALLYDDEDVVTTVRFIVMSKPNQIHLHNCQIHYEQEQEHKQVTNFIQIHPPTIQPGELTYGVAQVTGNHQRADGAIITFSVGESDIKHEYKMFW